jgi:hypothetical protein
MADIDEISKPAMVVSLNPATDVVSAQRKHTKQPAANDGDCSDDIDVPDLITHGYGMVDEIDVRGVTSGMKKRGMKRSYTFHHKARSTYPCVPSTLSMSPRNRVSQGRPGWSPESAIQSNS